MRINSFSGGAPRLGPTLAACLCLMMILALPASAEVIHIYVAATGNDTAGDGSPSSPYRSIPRAAQAATHGAVIHVAPGTYTGGFMTTVSGTATERIRYVSEIDPVTKARARIVPPNSTVTTGGFWENRGSSLDIEGFEAGPGDRPALRSRSSSRQDVAGRGRR